MTGDAKRPLGILQLDTRFPRIPGDVSHPDSYLFPIIVKIVTGATFKQAEDIGNSQILDLFLQAARELEADGVFAITTSCGFMAQYQAEIASAVSIPVFLSSLLQIPLVYLMTQSRVGIITARASSLSTDHIRAAGVGPDLPLALAGLEDKPFFSQGILADGNQLDPERIEAEVLEAAGDLLTVYPDIGSFVLECHNLAPYGRTVAESLGKPVFDIITLAHWVHAGVFKRGFEPWQGGGSIAVLNNH